MSTEKPKTLEEIRSAGLEALRRELGIVGMIRFLQMFETGRGDYSVERHQWLDSLDLDTIVDEIRRRRETEGTDLLHADAGDRQEAARQADESV